MNPRLRRQLAWVTLVASLLGAPISMLTFAKDEPVTILILSWGAIWLTAFDVLCTSDVRVQQEDKDA